MSLKSMCHPSISFSPDGHTNCWGHCSPILAGFPPAKKKKKKTSCRKCPKRGCNKPTLTEDTLVDSLTSWPALIKKSALPHHVLKCFTWRYGEQNIFEVSNIQRKNKRGKVPSSTHKAARQWRRSIWQPGRCGGHRYMTETLRRFPLKPLQSLKQQINPWVQKYLLTCYVQPSRDTELETGSRGRKWNASHRWWPEINIQGRGLWACCKRMGKEKTKNGSAKAKCCASSLWSIRYLCILSCKSLGLRAESTWSSRFIPIWAGVRSGADFTGQPCIVSPAAGIR